MEVVLLWCFSLFLVLISIIFFAVYLYRWWTRNKNNIYKTTAPCFVPLEELIDVTNEQCCYVGVEATNFRYSSELDCVVKPFATPPIEACAGFCVDGFTPGMLTCFGGFGQKSFNKCLDSSSPKDCNGLSMPVARVDQTLYYVGSATENSCLNKGPCL